jgi:transposase
MYNGSITDKTHLTFMLDNTGKLGINNVCFVLDRGFVTQDNLDYMESKGYQFVTAFPSNRLEAYRLLDEYGALINKPAYRIHEHDLYGMTLDYACQGVKMKAHIYFDPDKKALDEKELYAHLHRLMAELKKMGKSKRITKKYTDYFKVDPEERKSLSFEVDNEKIDERIRRLGFFILLSTRLECNAAEVLTIYKGRDQIEKNFDQLKNDLDFKRLKTHLTRTTDGKLFMGFLALILRTQLLNSAKSNDAIKKLSMEKVLWELRKIKAASFADDSRIVTPLTKLQKTICSALGMTDEQLTEAFS